MASYEKIKFDVKKDPLDLRDIMYEGSLRELPPGIDNRDKVPFILDQHSEGACTGFGLAAVVNYLISNRQEQLPDINPNIPVSERMLYEMAKRYDEWDGEDYEGSSIRGAMKGWQKHGVCSSKLWPYKPSNTRPRLTNKRATDALKRPLGNYFRVRHHHLSHMHSALREVGILYASASVHSGWYKVSATTGRIPYRKRTIGGHAFAIVGYDQEGFWIQNSWGGNWGKKGFAHISYDDWLENGYDCWIARMGVPTISIALKSGVGKLSKFLAFDHLSHEGVILSKIQKHLVNIGHAGRLSNSGRYQTDKKDVSDIIFSDFPEVSKQWDKPRLMLYAHGGLNNEKASAARIGGFMPYFLKNNIYPLHFMWETGLLETFISMVKNAFLHKRFGNLWDQCRERLLDLADEGIELATRLPGNAVWSQMKENARCASMAGGGLHYLAGKIAACKPGDKPELHMVGHSAGSILLTHLIPRINSLGLKVKTLTFYAPACTTELFIKNVLQHTGPKRCIQRLTIFNLNDKTEQDDNVATVYNKSLLYLVSNAFEQSRNRPLLGLAKDLDGNKQIAGTLKKTKRIPTVIYTSYKPDIRLVSASTTHGDFDNDEDTLNSTLRIIRGSNTIAKEF